MKMKVKINNINFRDSKTFYSILNISIIENDNKRLKLKKTTLKGIIPQSIQKNDLLNIECSYNSKGDYLELIEIKETLSDDFKQIAIFLNNRLNRVSLKKCEGIVKKLGLDTINKILEDKNILKQFKFSDKKIDEIYDILKENEKFQELNFISKIFKISSEDSNRIYERYGKESIHILNSNPFILTWEGILPFKDSLRISKELKLDNELIEESIIINDIFTKCYQEGNTCILKEDIHNKLIQKDKLIEYKGFIYTKKLYDLERELEKKIKELYNRKYKIYTNYIIPKNLDEEQEKAILKCMSCNLLIITGGPGTGKTHTINNIVKSIKSINKSFCLLAPTGKAADRMSELTGEETFTIHRKLKINDFMESEEEITEDFCIVDESSMLDLELSLKLFSSISDNTKLILVGDVNQLPSVGVGQVFKDIIDSKLIDVITLNKIHRQSKNSKIKEVASCIINELPINYDTTDDFEFIFEDDTEKIRDYILEYSKIPNSQILTTQHETILGTENLNLLIQNEDNLINGFKVGDKVIQTINNYDLDVFNGNIGTVRETGETVIKGNLTKYVIVDFKNINKSITYLDKDIKELELAYVLTVHKSQGSEFETVIIPIHKTIDFMLNKNLIYTGITRSKKKLILIGQKEVFEEKIKVSGLNRNSNLLK